MAYLTFNNTALCDECFVDLCVWSDVLRKRRSVFRVDLPCWIVQIQLISGINEVHICFPERVDGSDIFPVTFEFICGKCFIVVKETWDDILTKVMVGIRILHICKKNLAKKLPVENINTHRSKVALRMLWLFFEFNDAAVAICVHDTETACFFHRYFNDCDRCIGIHFLMVIQHFVVIHFINMVTGKN